MENINLELIKQYDESLYNNVNRLMENGHIHEVYLQEYPIIIYLILSTHKGKHIRIHEIHKDTGKSDMVSLMGEEWKVVKDMMKIYKKPKKDELEERRDQIQETIDIEESEVNLDNVTPLFKGVIEFRRDKQ